MELDQLRYFLRIAERRSFTRAAEDLALSQPALSRSIARLEDELGQPVFGREARAVTLTDAGELLQARARQILSMVEDTVAEIADDGESGRVRVGAIPTIAPYFLPAVLRRFAQEHPKATLIVRESTTDSLLKSCAQGEVDLAILALPIAAEHLRTEELFEEELFLVMPPEHPLVALEKIRASDIEPHPFVLLDETHCLSDDIVSYCRKRSFQPVAVERASQLAMVQELVSLSHGLSFIPAMARELDRGSRRVYRSMASPPPTRRIGVAWNPHRFQSRLIQLFRGFLKQFAPGKAQSAPRGEAGRRRRA